ncbi:MAG: ATP synthase F1 subunit epsilon [Phycisphaerales bacterium]|nr:MAG: ATP synthase F1 subunit epsilon [Phycisphaerales bacterium]
MTTLDTFQCSIITPERKVLECDANFVAFPAHDGEMGVLNRRAPIVCKLGIGVLRVEGPAENHTMFVDGGFAQVVENRLTILTQQAREADDLEAAAAGQALIEARAMKITDDASFTARTDAIQRAQIQLKLAKPAS